MALKEYIADMEKLLKVDDDFDVTLVVGSDEELLRAHRNILSAR